MRNYLKFGPVVLEEMSFEGKIYGYGMHRKCPGEGGGVLSFFPNT